MLIYQREKNRTVIIQVFLLVVIFVFFLSSSVVLAYWYVFGSKRPLDKLKNTPRTESQSGFQYPKHELKSVIKQKMFKL